MNMQPLALSTQHIKFSVQLREARVDLEAGAPQRALARYDQILSLRDRVQPEHQFDAKIGAARAWNALAEQQARRGGSPDIFMPAQAKALFLFEQALREAPNDPSLLATSARIALKLGQAHKALEFANRSMQSLCALNPTQPATSWLWLVRGKANLLVGNPQQALNDCQVVLQRNAVQAEALALKGLALHQLGQHEAALYPLAQSQAAYPRDELIARTLRDATAAAAQQSSS